MTQDLTILIPTWDRPDQVNERLREINRLWQGAVKVRIQVNPGRYRAADIDVSLHDGPLEIRENSVNIEFVANVVAGLSDLDSEWLWVLGDDDPIRPEAPALLARAIERADQCDAAAVLFNQWPVPVKGAADEECDRGQSGDGLAFPFCCRDFESFRQHTEFGNVLFITASLWRLRFFRANLGVFVDYSYSRASQAQIYLLALLSGSASFVVFNEPLIDYVYAHRWSRLDYLSRILAIFAEPAVRAQQAAVTDFLWSQCRWAFLSAAHEQVRSGQITLVAWLRVALRFSIHLLTHEPLSASLPRLIALWRIPLEIAPASHYLSVAIGGLRRSALRLFPRRS